jgi:hypothetical protein
MAEMAEIPVILRRLMQAAITMLQVGLQVAVA